MKKSGCNHTSKKCQCYDWTDAKWAEALELSRKQGGMTLQEIGDILGTTRMAQCSQEKRILKKFKQMLEERGVTAADI